MIIGISGEVLLKDPLVIFPTDDNENLHGVIFKQKGGKFLVYSFAEEKSQKITPSSCTPFTANDYHTMCENNWWKGITFTFVGKDEGGTIYSGVFDDNGVLNFVTLCGATARFPIEPSQITLTGHIN